MKKVTFILTVLMITALVNKGIGQVHVTPADLFGTWKVHQIGEDDNGNGSIDPGEIATVDTLDFSMQFKSDMTGILSIQKIGLQQNFTWELVNSNEDVTITIAETHKSKKIIKFKYFKVKKNGQTDDYHVEKFALPYLNLSSSSNGELQWLYLKKQ